MSGRRRTAIPSIPFIVLAIMGILTLLVSSATADESKPSDEIKEVRQIRALKINPHAPKIDGNLDDIIWHKAEFFSGFTQKDPKEGEPAANQTEVAVIYDENAVYFAARMLSQKPDDIMATVSRRDKTGNSERVIISLDTYHDKRTAYSFAVTAAGTRIDYYHRSDSEGDRDYDFNPVWEAASIRTADGWNAEMRIPFTQIRFKNQDVQTWGININRFVPTESEDSYWIMIPKEETGWSSKMGELVGIQGIAPSRRVELLPYFASDAKSSNQADAENPFAQKNEFDTRVGGNVKMGVGPNLTLEGTINPDFGQVEADPAVVNLSAFETFFPERRPFFTEGSQLLKGIGPSYFYSRRIGAAPHHSPDADYVDSPDNTSIIGAAKLTGRLNSGLSIGVLGAVTDREKAQTFNTSTGVEGVEEVEPRSGYGVVRLQQEVGKNASTIGVILTGVERNMSPASELTELLSRRAVSGGADWNLRFAEGKYELMGYVGGSHVEGTTEAISEVQQSSAHYLQRPDADHVRFDPTRTSLNGWVGKLRFDKRAGKHWRGGMGVDAESPMFEINDIGQISTADDINNFAWFLYRHDDPGRLYQNWRIFGSVGSGFNFGGDRQYAYLDLEGVYTFKNFMGTFLGVELYPASQSDNLTRGGPSMGTGNAGNIWLSLWSNGKNKTTWDTWTGLWANELGQRGYQVGAQMTFRPGTRWELSVNPRWVNKTEPRQYVTEEEGGSAATYDMRYVFASVERSELSAQLRLNYAFTPNFTLEFYAEPFASSGKYSKFGELEAARSKYLREYGSDGTSIEKTGDGIYTVTDGDQTFELEQSDFNYVSFRSNMVLRWEWNPGSTLFVVWQQNRSDDTSDGSQVGFNNLRDSLSAPGDNFFAIKVTYWIPFL